MFLRLLRTGQMNLDMFDNNRLQRYSTHSGDTYQVPTPNILYWLCSVFKIKRLSCSERYIAAKNSEWWIETERNQILLYFSLHAYE